MAGQFGVQRGGAGSAGFYMYTEGLEELVRQLRAQGDADMDEVEDALWDALDRYILQPSLPICPIKTGRLRHSGYVNVARSGRWKIEGVVGFDTDYALYVHENPDAYHKPPTRWKWLEETFALNSGKVLAEVEEKVKAASS